MSRDTWLHVGPTCDAGHVGRLGGADPLEGEAAPPLYEAHQVLPLAVHQCHADPRLPRPPRSPAPVTHSHHHFTTSPFLPCPASKSRFPPMFSHDLTIPHPPHIHRLPKCLDHQFFRQSMHQGWVFIPYQRKKMKRSPCWNARDKRQAGFFFLLHHIIIHEFDSII